VLYLCGRVRVRQVRQKTVSNIYCFPKMLVENMKDGWDLGK
jgi:hypothetical protein